MNDKICEAIRNKSILRFHYDGGVRFVEPHSYGITTAGNEGLRAFQIDGYSSTNTLGWKMFDLANAAELTVLNESFIEPRPGYRRGDRGMTRIFEQL